MFSAGETSHSITAREKTPVTQAGSYNSTPEQLLELLTLAPQTAELEHRLQKAKYKKGESRAGQKDGY